MGFVSIHIDASAVGSAKRIAFALTWLLFAEVCFTGCGLLKSSTSITSLSSAVQSAPVAPVVPGAMTAEAQLFADLPHGVDAMAILCAGPFPHDDVAGTFCQPNIPVITSLNDLMSVLHVSFANTTASGGNGTGGNPFFALQAHSSALARSETSALMPQALVFNNLTPAVPLSASNAAYVAVAFTRGPGEIVEIATRDPNTGEIFFYVVKFYHACDFSHTCTNADYFSPAVEKNWVAYDVYENEPHLLNTLFDCRHCHNPGGPVNSESILRLQELTAPYTHFLSTTSAGGTALLADFHAVHGTGEDYGPIPAALIDKGDPSQFAAFVTGTGFANQPNAFDSATIEAQVQASDPAQPTDNSLPGTSAAWDAIFNNFLQGLAIPPPYHDVKVADPIKAANYTQAYLGVINGTQPPTAMPDFRDVLPDSQAIRSQMGLAPVPGETATALVVNACMECHNSNLDQTISRAKFDVGALLNGTMSASEKQVAIERITAAQNSLLLMPPRRFQVLSASDIQTLTEYLKK